MHGKIKFFKAKEINKKEEKEMEKERNFDIKENEVRITLPRENQIFYGKILECVKILGAQAKITDFARLLGGYAREKDGETQEYIGTYWTKTVDWLKLNAITVGYDGGKGVNHVDFYDTGFRPLWVLPKAKFFNVDATEITRLKDENGNFNGILKIKHGYYPQYAPNEEFQKELNDNFRNLKETGNGYTVDLNRNNGRGTPFKEERLKEYEYKGKRYVRVKNELPNLLNQYGKIYEGIQMDNGVICKKGDYVWIEVAPVEWLICEKDDLPIAEKILIAGVPFDHKGDYEEKDYEETDACYFLNNCFLRDIMQNVNVKHYEEFDDIENQKTEKYCGNDCREFVKETVFNGIFNHLYTLEQEKTDERE